MVSEPGEVNFRLSSSRWARLESPFVGAGEERGDLDADAGEGAALAGDFAARLGFFVAAAFAAAAGAAAAGAFFARRK